MRVRSCLTTAPAPRFRWPTSLLPICPSGSPTSLPEAPIRVQGLLANKRSMWGARARRIALPSLSGRSPYPSSTTRTTREAFVMANNLSEKEDAGSSAVRLAAQDRERAVDLFAEHHPRQSVRQGQRGQ